MNAWEAVCHLELSTNTDELEQRKTATTYAGRNGNTLEPAPLASHDPQQCSTQPITFNISISDVRLFLMALFLHSDTGDFRIPSSQASPGKARPMSSPLIPTWTSAGRTDDVESRGDSME